MASRTASRLTSSEVRAISRSRGALAHVVKVGTGIRDHWSALGAIVDAVGRITERAPGGGHDCCSDVSICHRLKYIGFPIHRS